jgi:hypothetical protein
MPRKRIAYASDTFDNIIIRRPYLRKAGIEELFLHTRCARINLDSQGIYWAYRIGVAYAIDEINEIIRKLAIGFLAHCFPRIPIVLAYYVPTPSATP